MATTKKYAGLPDLDDAGTELFQTPGLTDDASTVQSSTVRTESPTPSEEVNDNFDRTTFNREQARRRFEPAVVDAKDVNFSYAIGGAQKSYVSKHRRRRRVQKSNGMEEYGDISDEEDRGLEESLGQKLARLKREAEEIRLEIERRENESEGGEFQESFEHLQGDIENEDEADLVQGVDSLSRLLNGLQTSVRSNKGSIEQEFTRRLEAENLGQKRSQPTENQKPDTSSPSTITAITAFSDRLSALESALGLSNISPTPNSTGILPTLDTLTNQITLVYSTIAPKQPLSTNLTAASTSLTTQMPYLDILQSRLHTLHQSATTLLNTRKQAQTTLSDLENVRLRSIRHADNLSRYQNFAARRHNRVLGTSHQTNTNDPDDDNDHNTNARPTSRNGPGHRSTTTEEARERLEIADEIMTPLFLEEQAEKINALYNVLPTIQDLQPLLPVVLDRLRALSVVHAGAADARSDLDEVEGRLTEWETELVKWKDAVVGVEEGIEEMKVIMKENVDVVGGMVERVEQRIAKLDG